MSKNGKAEKSALRESYKQSVTHKLFDVSRQMRSDLSRRLLKLELYGGQERIILLLADHDGLSPGEIASQLSVSAPTIAKSVNRLSSNGIVVRRNDHGDRRRATVHLTNLGHSMVKKIKKEQKKWVKSALKGLKSSERKALSKYLNHIAQNLQKVD